jgi:hypothetical protein
MNSDWSWTIRRATPRGEGAGEGQGRWSSLDVARSAHALRSGRRRCLLVGEVGGCQSLESHTEGHVLDDPAPEV